MENTIYIYIYIDTHWVAVKELFLSCYNKDPPYLLYTHKLIASLTVSQFVWQRNGPWKNYV